MTIDYLKTAENLVTENQFNRLHIDLGNSITPLEFSDLAEQYRAGQLPERASDWLRQIHNLSPSMASDPQSWVAESINEQLTWYRSRTGEPDSAPAPSRGKRLLVAFCGNAGRLMLPLPVVLQALPANDWNMIRVTRTRGSRYLRGGHESEDFSNLLSSIDNELGRVRYRELTCMGTSSGAALAMLIALRLKAKRCISICGSWSPGILPMVPELSGGRLPRGEANCAEWPCYLFVYGEHHNSDRNNARTLYSLLGGRMLPVSGVADHNVFYQLLLQGRFFSEFNSLMLGNWPPAHQEATGYGTT